MYADLIDQARELATRDAKKPKQANLRRAVSAVYYALFHYFVDEACCVGIGSQRGQASYRHVLGRAFVHQTMKQACTSFGGGTLKDAVSKGLPRSSFGNYVIPKAVQNIAATFAELLVCQTSFHRGKPGGDELRPCGCPARRGRSGLAGGFSARRLWDIFSRRYGRFDCLLACAAICSTLRLPQGGPRTY